MDCAPNSKTSNYETSRRKIGQCLCNLELNKDFCLTTQKPTILYKEKKLIK